MDRGDEPMAATIKMEQTPLNNVMNDTDVSLDELHMAIDRLSEKLDDVKSEQIESSVDKDGGEPYPGSSRVVQRLSGQQFSIRRAEQYIRQMTRQLEV